MCTDAEFVKLVSQANSYQELGDLMCHGDAKSNSSLRLRAKRLNLNLDHIRKNIKYTDADLTEAVKSANSMREVASLLGASSHAGMQNHFARRVKSLGISTSHFTTSAKTKSERKSWEDYLVLNPEHSPRLETPRLKKALIQSGAEEKCSMCGILDYNGRLLVFQIDHINGKPWDNRRGNLRFLCPNCHSQETVLLIASRRPSKPRCLDCNKEIASKSQRCRSCSASERNRREENLSADYPDAKVLLEKLASGMTYEALAGELGVSSNAVRKRLRSQGVEPPRRQKLRAATSATQTEVSTVPACPASRGDN